MANYEGEEESLPYGVDDAYSTTPNLMYVNQQEQDQAAKDKIAIEAKQNVIVMQPTNPPPNPQKGDMWIDNNVFPNIIYTWNSTEWIKATATSATEVGAYTIAQTDAHAEQIAIDTAARDERIEIVENRTDADSITSTVTQHATYIADRDAAIDGKVSDAIAELPVYLTEAEFKIRAEAITASFKSQGGVNLLKNSVGYAGLLNWQVVSGAASQQIGGEMVESGSGFVLNDGVIKQAVSAIVGNPYTITVRVNKGTIGSSYLKLSDGNNFQQVNMIETARFDYQEIQIKNFIPTNNVLIVEFGAVGVEGGAIFTSAMLNTGEVGLQWSHADGEVYNSSVKLDINGVTVNSSVYDGYTVMSPVEFSGYFRNGQGVMQKIFTLNKDFTEVAKLAVTDTNAEITMGALSILQIDSGGKKGWAFVATS